MGFKPAHICPNCGSPAHSRKAKVTNKRGTTRYRICTNTSCKHAWTTVEVFATDYDAFMKPAMDKLRG